MGTLTIAFRVDASIDIGTGHVMRCLTLASFLRELGADCLFICRAHSGNLVELIRERNYDVSVLSADDSSSMSCYEGSEYAEWLGTSWIEDAEQARAAIAKKWDRPVDWLVVDHYALDARWEQQMGEIYHRLMVIDDLANRSHQCDILLDQNLDRSVGDYNGLVPPACIMLLGPQYALLRPEFAHYRSISLARRAEPDLKHLLISFGGVDKNNATGMVLNSLDSNSLDLKCRITIVMGPHAPWLKSIKRRAAGLPWPTEVLVNSNNIARIMSDSDLAISAGGSTSWERCCLGLPTILIVLAKNQWSAARALHACGGAVLLGGAEEIPSQLGERIKTIQRLMSGISLSASKICTGEGVTKVVAQMSACSISNT